MIVGELRFLDISSLGETFMDFAFPSLKLQIQTEYAFPEVERYS